MDPHQYHVFDAAVSLEDLVRDACEHAANLVCGENLPFRAPKNLSPEAGKSSAAAMAYPSIEVEGPLIPISCLASLTGLP